MLIVLAGLPSQEVKGVDSLDDVVAKGQILNKASNLVMI